VRRIRITSRNSDGSRSNEPPVPSEPGSTWPYVRGKNLNINIVEDDGTLTPLPSVKSVSIHCAGRAHPVLATIEVFAEVDVEALEDSDPVKVALLSAKRWEEDAKSSAQALTLKQESVDKLWKENDELRARVEALENRAVTVDAANEPSRVAKLAVAGMAAIASVKIE
jgi:hypothetical protein